MAVFPKNSCDCTGVVDVTGDHQPSRRRMAFTESGQALLSLQQHLLSDAAAVRQADGPSEVACSPALSLFLRQR